MLIKNDPHLHHGDPFSPLISLSWNDGTPLPIMVETPRRNTDHNETRSWHGWHRHVSLVMLVFAMMAVIRHRANAEPALKKTRRRRTKHRS
jgi:hypothetical protein